MSFLRSSGTLSPLEIPPESKSHVRDAISGNTVAMEDTCDCSEDVVIFERHLSRDDHVDDVPNNNLEASSRDDDVIVPLSPHRISPLLQAAHELSTCDTLSETQMHLSTYIDGTI